MNSWTSFPTMLILMVLLSLGGPALVQGQTCSQTSPTGLAKKLGDDMVQVFQSLKTDPQAPVFLHPLTDFERSEQEKIMDLVFQNEKKSWSDRAQADFFGERLEDYLYYLDTHKGVGLTTPFPGFILVNKEIKDGKVPAENLVGYTVGIFDENGEEGDKREISYEVVTTFIAPAYRKKSLSVLLGLKNLLVLNEMKVPRMIQDTKKGGLEAITRNLQMMLKNYGLSTDRVTEVLEGREDSYQLPNGEQFERYIIRIDKLME